MKLQFIVLQGLKYFILQTILEVNLIILLLYLGMSYFDMKIGSEHFFEIVEGVLGYYAFTKCIYYIWIYIIAFSSIVFIGKLKTNFSYSIVNAILSLFYIMLFLINGRLFKWILNPLMASLISSLFIILVFRNKPISRI